MAMDGSDRTGGNGEKNGECSVISADPPKLWCVPMKKRCIGAYPSAFKSSQSLQARRQLYSALAHPDCEDSLTCALIAGLFAGKRDALMPVENGVSTRVGWIWVPRDAFVQ
jgi:hypothetical protein